MSVSLQPVTCCSLADDWLDAFDRQQSTTRVLAMVEGKLVEREDHFENDWSPEARRDVIASLRRSIEKGGVVLGAQLGDPSGRLLGFANIEAEPFGPEAEYRELGYLHVDRRERGRGIGRLLFERCCDEARRLGARKMYIGAHPAVQTQAFYRSLGCVPASYVHRPIYDREPRDIQLECTV